VDGFANEGRTVLPWQVKLTVWNLRFNQMEWVTVDGMEQEWERARVNAKFTEDNGINASTTNVSALTFELPKGGTGPDLKGWKPSLSVDGQKLTGLAIAADGSWVAHLRKAKGKWKLVKSADSGELKKKHGLQGPIDDAFMDSFIMVRPTGEPLNQKIGAWIDEGLKHAMEEWHLQFRGEARVKDDSAITKEDMASNNLILWGDPKSNKLLAKLVGKLPIRWDAAGVKVGTNIYSAEDHAPVLIYPNPLNPKRYVVLNTGFTFSEVGRPSNALQIPKLPDYAVVDMNVPLAKRIPEGVVVAGFFDEQWRLPSQR
jgi:hypothetical protein